MADIKKMKLVGICTVKGIQMTTRKALCNIKGLSEAKVEKIKEAVGKMLVKELITCSTFGLNAGLFVTSDRQRFLRKLYEIIFY